MILSLNHNLMATQVLRNLTNIYKELSVSTQRLSSGLRINSAADDAAGLAIREKMRTDIRVMAQSIRNAADSISMLQTAEGAMSVIDEKLVRMKELAQQAATGTYTTAQRAIINSEYQAMAAEIDRIANATTFNGLKLLDGSLTMSHAGSGMKVHFGLGNNPAEDYYFMNIGDVRATRETGLRVGNSDPRDTIRTTNLKSLSPTSALEESNSAADGFFGIRYTDNFDSETPAAASWSLYGYVDIDASRTSINEMVQNINQGAQAQGSFSFAAASYTTTMAKGMSLTINGQIFGFSTQANGSYSGSTGTIGLDADTSSAAVAARFSKYINSKAASIGVYAALQGTTVHLIAHAFGTQGNNIETSNSGGGITSNQEKLSGGGRKTLTASAAYNEESDTWELQLQMNQGGEKYQLQTFAFASLGQASGATIIGGAISGIAFTTVDSWMSRLLMGGGVSGTAITMSGGSGKATVYGGADGLNEWIQTQNGSARTNWDGADLLTQSAAQRALNSLDAAIMKKDMERANLGIGQNRLESTINLLQIQMGTLQAAESRISDIDVALEMSNFLRNQIKAQVATAMLAQANSMPQLILKLITG